ncbi:ribosome maturation factor RimM [Nitratireductor aestuarii]|uniref:Ribosome maturation factor RimM n=1 Tax=Nitratireductor aestuarii TaxID=1735103 RepID=A0A916RLV2_9HYPH|nr:ribosome maturation factor RimM [Nitratireductor aestuarii]GGA60115.1 ribosome maturation factor RimM [Nitratireductor aestuarii]
MAKLENPVQLGVIGAPHGIKGEVRVKTFTEDPTALGNYGPLTTEDGATLTIRSVRPSKTVVVVRFKEIQDRNAAELLNGKGLFVERDALPDDLDEEEFYHADLIGLEVRDEEGETVGKITAVQNFGAGDMLEVRPRGGASVFIPFTKLAVPAIDFDSGIVTVNRELAGLIDKEEDLELREKDEPEADA